MSAPPNRTDLAGTPTVATYKIAIGLLYDYVASLLGNGTATIATNAEQVKAREYLGVGSFGFKNRFVNPEFMIDQEFSGASISVPVSATPKYLVDQWYALSTGAAITAQRIAGISERKYSLRLTGATSNTAVILGHRIESDNCADLKNQTVTVSLKSKASSARTVTWTAYYANSADDFTSKTSIATGSLSVTTSTTAFSFSFNAGANASNGIAIEFSTATLGLAETLDFDQMQIEKSSVVTEFESRSVQQESDLCQRYYEILNVLLQVYLTAGGTHATTLSWRTTKRTTPTITNTLVNAGNSASRSASALATTAIQFATVSTSAGYSAINGTIIGNARL